MSGTSVVFDTNALIGFLTGKPSLKLYANSHVFLSVITVIEFLSYPNISTSDKNLFEGFLRKVTVVNLDLNNPVLIEKIIESRKVHRLKLPDAIITATSLLHECGLVSNDKELSKVPRLAIIRF